MDDDVSPLPERIVAEARAWAGTPYRHQASLKGVGCDCLGLLRGVWRGVIGPEPEEAPPYAASWAESAPAGTDPLLAAARRHLVPIAVPMAADRPLGRRRSALLVSCTFAGKTLRHRHRAGRDDPCP